MTFKFDRQGPDRIRAVLSADELRLLRDLPDQLRTVLGSADDPANERLFPPAYLEVEDVEAQQEYRRLMQDDLAEEKRAAIRLVTESLERAEPFRGGLLGRVAERYAVELREDEALAWLGVLNDIRLTLGVRLEVTDDLDGDLDGVAPDDPRGPGLRLLYYLGWMEESLLEALAP